MNNNRFISSGWDFSVVGVVGEGFRRVTMLVCSRRAKFEPSSTLESNKSLSMRKFILASGHTQINCC